MTTYLIATVDNTDNPVFNPLALPDDTFARTGGGAPYSQTPHSPIPAPVLTVSGAAGVKANS